ncbi:MAG: hypothetical protein K2X27_06410, partial [Candidatus Obscuribacterales bacterium]|nr:hypothetical protein [Candidatus Obscuribacterales bacterium]
EKRSYGGGEGRSYGEKRSYGGGEGRSYGEKRSYGGGEGRSYGEKKSYGGGEGRSYGEKKSYGGGEGRSYGEKKSSESFENRNYGETENGAEITEIASLKYENVESDQSQDIEIGVDSQNFEHVSGEAVSVSLIETVRHENDHEQDKDEVSESQEYSEYADAPKQAEFAESPEANDDGDFEVAESSEPESFEENDRPDLQSSTESDFSSESVSEVAESSYSAPPRRSPTGPARSTYGRADVVSSSRPQRPRAESRGYGREREERPDNVHLSLSPRMLELAEQIAEENGMDLNEYLVKALVLVIKTQAGQMGMLGRPQYVTEFTREKTAPVTRVSK